MHYNYYFASLSIPQKQQSSNSWGPFALSLRHKVHDGSYQHVYLSQSKLQLFV